MDELNQILGEQGAIVDDQMPLDLDLDLLSLFHSDLSKSQLNNKEVIGEKMDKPTSYFTNEMQFIEENAFFKSELFESNSLSIESPDKEEKQEPEEQMKPILEKNIAPNLHEEESEQFQIPEKKNKKRKKAGPSSSETKNIPKNYGKQIIKFIQVNQKLVTPILEPFNVSYKEFVANLKVCKKKMNRILDLKNLWTEHKYAVPIRIISEHFLRKYSFHWIFNSRIEEIRFPIKYRRRIIQAVMKPDQFQYLKEYS